MSEKAAQPKHTPHDRSCEGSPDTGADAARCNLSVEYAQHAERAAKQAKAPSSYTTAKAEYGSVEKPESAPLDPKRPTVAVFDDFMPPPFGQKIDDMAHAIPTETAAQQHGFNVIRLTRGPNDTGYPNYGRSLTDIADAIDQGKLPLGKGDIINLSMNNVAEFAGLAPPQIAIANKLFGLNITPDNLPTMVPKIIEKMKAVADGQLSPDLGLTSENKAYLQESMKQLLLSNAAIDRIQKHGVEVINSAGNAGPNQIDLGFLKAKTHLSALDESNQRMFHSAQNKMDTPELSVFPLFYQGANAQYPAGSYRMGNSDVRFDAKDFGGTPTHPQYYYKDLQGIYEPITGHSPGEPSGPFSLDKDPVGVVQGTSYANILYLQQNYERLRRLKTHGG